MAPPRVVMGSIAGDVRGSRMGEAAHATMAGVGGMNRLEPPVWRRVEGDSPRHRRIPWPVAGAKRRCRC